MRPSRHILKDVETILDAHCRGRDVQLAEALLKKVVLGPRRLDSNAGFGERYRGRLLHKIIKNHSGSGGNNAGN